MIIMDGLPFAFSEKPGFREFFNESCDRVGLTTDTWTSMQQQSYMCVTAHSLDTGWKLHKQIYWVLLGDWS